MRNNISMCWNRPDPIVLMMQVLAAMLRATRVRRVFATGAKVAAEAQVRQQNQCFAV
jgi:hypothetical protein